VPAGTYNLLVYSVGFDFSANYYQGYSLTGGGSYPVYHGIAERGLDVLNNVAFRRITSTSAASPTGGNYVQFDNISPAGDGSLVLSVTWEPPNPTISNGYQPTVNAIQLVRVVPVTARPSLGVIAGAGSVTVNWTDAAAGYTLKSSATVGGGALWTAVPGVANPITGAGSTTVNTTAGAAYFRLEK
jgi:hypothetical protein